MTKLGELKVARDAAWAAAYAASDAEADVAWAAWADRVAAYQVELKKIQKENSDD
tara:strand:- start:1227 stop:1391 length:165 start_codon:yes stop_codon:yes gene_type:complete